MTKTQFGAASEAYMDDLDIPKIHKEAPQMHGVQARAPPSAIY